jgi:hypothetical protein
MFYESRITRRTFQQRMIVWFANSKCQGESENEFPDFTRI